MENWTINKLYKDDAKDMEQLIKKVFDEYIAPDYSIEGVNTFYNFIHHDAIIKRMKEGNHVVYGAKVHNKLIGVIETRDNSHICLLFVDKNYHKNGIAKALFNEAFKDCKNDITVNSSPYAVTIYERLGFEKISGELIRDGITFIPMMKNYE